MDGADRCRCSCWSAASETAVHSASAFAPYLLQMFAHLLSGTSICADLATRFRLNEQRPASVIRSWSHCPEAVCRSWFVAGASRFVDTAGRHTNPILLVCRWTVADSPLQSVRYIVAARSRIGRFCSAAD